MALVESDSDFYRTHEVELTLSPLEFRTRRVAARITKAGLARASGVSAVTVYNFESGARPVGPVTVYLMVSALAVLEAQEPDSQRGGLPLGPTELTISPLEFRTRRRAARITKAEVAAAAAVSTATIYNYEHERRPVGSATVHFMVAALTALEAQKAAAAETPQGDKGDV